MSLQTLELENTEQRVIQTSPAHSVLFITRFRESTTTYEAYLLSIPKDKAPELGTEPLDHMTLKICWASMIHDNWDGDEFKILANRCIPSPEDYIGYKEERVS